MYLKTLHLLRFRNYWEQQVTFSAPKTILVGNNAQGKSNLLEAVELLATLRSHRALRDRELVLNDETVGQIQASIERQTGTAEAGLIFRSSGRRTATQNGVTLKRQLELLGVVNAVQFSSLDLELVRGGPSQRRSWLDTLLMQLEPVYASILQDYHQVLRQRNALLKQQAKQHREGGNSATSLKELAVWDAQLATVGTRVMRRRARAIARLTPLANAWHQAISSRTETFSAGYSANVPIEQDDVALIQQQFLDKIQQRAIAEQQQGTTLVGPHRDEIEFTINEIPARQYGSQGQQRTLVLALKLAELKLIETVIGEPPLLLLDDVLAELDLNRQNQLLETIQDHVQTLITTTHLNAFDADWLKSSQVLTVEAGRLISV